MAIELKVLFINLATWIFLCTACMQDPLPGWAELREQEISLSEGICQEERSASKET